MFKHTISELKEALVCLQVGQVTLNYPFQPHAPEIGFRGKPVVEADACIGCGACANACPARLISLQDVDVHRRISFDLSRCTYCARCRDVCPEKAISMSEQFEMSTETKDDLLILIELKLSRCELCGAAIGAQRAVDKVAAKLGESGIADREHLKLCVDCKRRESLRLAVPSQEVAI